MNRNKRIDVYVEYGELYFYYNGVEFCMLYQNPEAAAFASYFKRKVYGDLPGARYTDYHGWRGTREDFNSVISLINGIDNIKNNLTSIVGGCTNLDIQADLVVHLNGREFILVSDVDNDKYRANDSLGMSKKGYNPEVLHQLNSALDSLDAPSNTPRNVR